MHRTVRDLDVVHDLNDSTYKVVGALAWLILLASAVGAVAFPRQFVVGVRLVALYGLTNLLLTVTFYLVGIVRCRAWAKADAPDKGLEAVHHVVIIPNYREPTDVLCRTLEGLAAQDEASQRLTVVLAMEESEPGAYEKALALRAQFAGRFARVLITLHPAHLPGEVAGKGSNQTWAARQVRRELVDRLGMPIEQLTLTSCDADSILHPHYFATVGRLFAQDPQRYQRFWHAPILFHNNLWQAPAPIRLLVFFQSDWQIARLAQPFSWPLPISTYTLSYKLADQAGYWDPAVIGEDYHMFLRCFFATRGQVSLVPIFLPTLGDAVVGDTPWRALNNFYRQKLRHAWGAQDVGYILQQWHRTDTPLVKKLQRLTQSMVDHLIRSTFWLVVALGILAASLSHDTLLITLPAHFVYQDILKWAYVLTAIGVAALWAVQRAYYPSGRVGWRLDKLIPEIIAWALLPLEILGLQALPALHAQTKLLFGTELVYWRTPKVFVESREEACDA